MTQPERIVNGTQGATDEHGNPVNAAQDAQALAHSDDDGVPPTVRSASDMGRNSGEPAGRGARGPFQIDTKTPDMSQPDRQHVLPEEVPSFSGTARGFFRPEDKDKALVESLAIAGAGSDTPELHIRYTVNGESRVSIQKLKAPVLASDIGGLFDGLK